MLFNFFPIKPEAGNILILKFQPDIPIKFILIKKCINSVLVSQMN